MLIISLAPGESLVIGRSQLVVRGLEPLLRLDLMEHGLVKEVAFSRKEVAGQPTVQLQDALVFVQRVQRGRVVLGIDAPREVPVLKGEWSGGASGLDADGLRDGGPAAVLDDLNAAQIDRGNREAAVVEEARDLLY